METRQVHALLTHCVPRWTAALEDFGGDVIPLFAVAQQLTGATTHVAMAPTLHIPINVAEALLRVALQLRNETSAWKALVRSFKSFKKSGSVIGSLSKEQKERGFRMPLPTTPPPVIDGMALQDIVGAPLPTAKPNLPAIAMPAAGVPLPSVAAAMETTLAAVPGGRLHRDGGELFRMLSRWAQRCGVTTKGVCLGCLFLNDARLPHALVDCPRWDEVHAKAKAERLFRQQPSKVYPPHRRQYDTDRSPPRARRWRSRSRSRSPSWPRSRGRDRSSSPRRGRDTAPEGRRDRFDGRDRRRDRKY